MDLKRNCSEQSAFISQFTDLMFVLLFFSNFADELMCKSHDALRYNFAVAGVNQSIGSVMTHESRVQTWPKFILPTRIFRNLNISTLIVNKS